MADGENAVIRHWLEPETLIYMLIVVIVSVLRYGGW